MKLSLKISILPPFYFLTLWISAKEIISVSHTSIPELANSEPFNGRFFVMELGRRRLMLDTEGSLIVNWKKKLNCYLGRNQISWPNPAYQWTVPSDTGYQPACVSSLNGIVYLIGDHSGRGTPRNQVSLKLCTIQLNNSLLAQ